jgi:antitoxin YefM
MEAMSYSSFRQSLASVLDKVNDDSVPVHITRKGKKDAVVISMDDWSGIQETLYVLSNQSLMRQINTAEEHRNKGISGYKPTQDEMNEILKV